MEDYPNLGIEAPLNRRSPGNEQQAAYGTPKSWEDEWHRIVRLFDQQACRMLCIQEESEQSPWRSLIWPLAKQHPALWHAFAALSCFGMRKNLPQLRTEGARHIQRSAQLLAKNKGSRNEIPLDAALAATLALAFAETWDVGSSSTGTGHVQAAGMLLSRILSNFPGVDEKSDEGARVEFLYNTWTYMDVLARFTCSESSFANSAISLCPDWIKTGWNTSRLDPLMGYATTLFPIMRRVADLINKVRAKPTARNSPVIISQGLELKRIIEDWVPPIDLETVEDPSPSMTDAIQTAEAYRWSTLGLLYQAVPELPNLTSYGELAQKILVYLATIPLNSATIIVHVLPLMVAGNDAVEEEDRDFVRERWGAMSKRMVTGMIEQCLEITEEVWRRRDEHPWARGTLATPNTAQGTRALNDSAALLNSNVNAVVFGTNADAAHVNYGGSSSPPPKQRHNIRRANDFPISAAFKKGVDPLTRSGCSDYTVRGRLHWLGVMKDWNLRGISFS